MTHRDPDDPSIALRFEAFVAGMELGNAYTELNDPRVQEENFRRQVAGIMALGRAIAHRPDPAWDGGIAWL